MGDTLQDALTVQSSLFPLRKGRAAFHHVINDNARDLVLTPPPPATGSDHSREVAAFNSGHYRLGSTVVMAIERWLP